MININKFLLVSGGNDKLNQLISNPDQYNTRGHNEPRDFAAPSLDNFGNHFQLKKNKLVRISSLNFI